MFRQPINWIVLLASCSVLACEDPVTPLSDGGPRDQLVLPQDGLTSGEAGSVPAVDFVVQGCAERSETGCSGPVPLRLIFSAVLKQPDQSVRWDFGDGSPGANGPVVEHSFTIPGSYTITLVVREAGGTVSERKQDFVVASPAGPGAACASDAACSSGRCACQEEGSCAFPLDDGLCLQECLEVACHLPGTVCVDLGRALPAEPSPWQQRICLPSCSSDADCQRPGFHCGDAPGAISWHRVCVPQTLRTIGAFCRSSSGELVDEACLGGVCLDLGAGGYCSATCGPEGCPQGSRCAAINNLSPMGYCLQQCGDGDCQSDPYLACESPDILGEFGFKVLGPADPPQTTYCAPRRCAEDGECGLAGRCDLSQGGFCLPDAP